MKKLLLYSIFLFGVTYSCLDAKAEQGVSKSKVFDKVDKRNKKLFTEEERINSYNKSLKKSESISLKFFDRRSFYPKYLRRFLLLDL